jgi:DNA repair photolyase
MKAGAGGAGAAPIVFKGRGAADNPQGRFERQQREAVDDGWTHEDTDTCAPRTEVTLRQARTIISRNESPDIPFSQSINPYQGCEHGCIYCYARPSHAYLGLSPGLDFETKLFAKANAVPLLRAELSRPGYRCEVISLGANTDPYQPIERSYKITRGILEVLSECNHPLGIVNQILRLPYELKDLFKDWAERHHPLKAARIMSEIRQMRGGRENDPRFGARLSGEGVFAELQEQRFRLACERHGLNREGRAQLDATRFRPPSGPGQLNLF